jgi:hypothetical protein
MNNEGDRLSADTVKQLAELVKIYKDALSKLGKGITLQIVDIQPFFDPFHRNNFMVGYRVIDGKYTSPIAHFWMRDLSKLGQSIKDIVRSYKRTLRRIRKHPKKRKR